jgi:hypothetical protein
MTPARSAAAAPDKPAAAVGFPNLCDVITPDDVSTKGTGTYKADFVNWCRVAHLLHVHAPGWQFHLRPTAEGHHVWAAPNGTGYVVGYFTGPDAEVTPDFPQAVMDNRNAPVPMDRISARDLTDSHRRCLCTAAAATFGLAWQLWAREEIENPHRDTPAPAVAPVSKTAVPLEKVLPIVEHAIQQSGLTQFGIRTVIHLFSGGRARSLREVPQDKLELIPTYITRPDKVDLFNQGLNPRTQEVVLVPEPSDLEDPEDQSLLSLAGAAA